MNAWLPGDAGLGWARGLGMGLAAGILLGVALAGGLAIALERRARARRLASAAELTAQPRPSLIVVLGCPPRTRSGLPSRYLVGRAQVAADAFHALESVPILCSGRGEPGALDEVGALAALLEAAGVPREALRFDRSARRTLDTIDHLAARHRRERCLLVTQSFHLPRALFLARAHDLDAWGLAAPGPSPGFRVRLRESLGQLRAIWDSARPRRAR